MSPQSKKLIRLAGISGIIDSTLPLIMILASTVLEKSFSWNKNALSDIGLSQKARAMNALAGHYVDMV
jgi:hypothetical membrane protein